MKRVIAGLLAAVLLLAAACAPPTPAPPTPAPPTPAPPTPAPPVALNVLKFLIPTDLTGPAAVYGPAHIEGWLDYFRYAEDEGLVPEGLKLEVVYEDTKYDLAREIAIYKKHRIDPDIVFSSTLATAAAEALKKLFPEDKILHFHNAPTSRNAMHPADGYSFAIGPLYNEEPRATMHWLKENHWKEDRPAKVAIMGWDYATGNAWSEGFAVGTEEVGWELLGVSKYPFPTLPDLTPALVKYKAAGVDYITWATPVGTLAGVFLRDLEKVGLLGKITPVVFGGNCDQSLISLAGEKAEGVIALSNIYLWDEVDEPGVKLMHELRDRYHGGKAPTQIWEYTQNIAQSIVMMEVLRLACADMPAQQIGRGDLQKYLMKVKDFDTMVAGKVTEMVLDDPRIAKQSRAVQVQGGKVVILSDFFYVPPWKATEWDWFK